MFGSESRPWGHTQPGTTAEQLKPLESRTLAAQRFEAFVIQDIWLKGTSAPPHRRPLKHSSLCAGVDCPHWSSR